MTIEVRMAKPDRPEFRNQRPECRIVGEDFTTKTPRHQGDLDTGLLESLNPGILGPANDERATMNETGDA
jgi:hypothetical protein